MAGKTAVGEEPLQFTPTWIVAVVCSFIVVISLVMERFLHYIGKRLQKNKMNALYEALEKIKEELMLLGFISLLLVVFQGFLHRICVPPSYMTHMRPCKKVGYETIPTGLLGGGRRLFAGGGKASDVCVSKGKVPVISVDAIHKLHIFIFILAVTHVLFSVMTMILGLLRIRQWEKWEKEVTGSISNDPSKVNDIYNFEFIRKRYKGFGKVSSMRSWLYSFGKQLFGSVRKSDYTTMRLGFIMAHCPGNPSFRFHDYMMRALEDDFKKVIGLSWYLWIFVLVFLLVNIDGWRSYFWLSFLPFILLLAVGTKLEHVICQLADEVANKNVFLQGKLIVKPSDKYFWFHQPRFVLYLIHFILFQTAFDIAFFIWSLTSFGWNSCFMGKPVFVYPRLVLGVIIQILCSYSTLPLYAIVTQMGNHFKKAIFDEKVHGRLLEWANGAKSQGGTKETPANPHRESERSPDALLHDKTGIGEISTEGGSHGSVV